MGVSYGGFVAYWMAEMWPERVEKVVIACSAVNMRPSDNDRLLKQSGVDEIEDLFLPVTASQLRASLRFVVSRPSPYMPDFVLNDYIDVSRSFSVTSYILYCILMYRVIFFSKSNIQIKKIKMECHKIKEV